MDKQGRLFGISVLGACALLATLARPPDVPFASPPEAHIGPPGAGLAARQPSQSQSHCHRRRAFGSASCIQRYPCRRQERPAAGKPRLQPLGHEWRPGGPLFIRVCVSRGRLSAGVQRRIHRRRPAGPGLVSRPGHSERRLDGRWLRLPRAAGNGRIRRHPVPTSVRSMLTSCWTRCGTRPRNWSKNWCAGLSTPGPSTHVRVR